VSAGSRYHVLLWFLALATFTLWCPAAAQEVEVTFPAQCTPCNPLGHGYNVAFFERGMSDALNDSAVGRQLSCTLRELHTTALRYPGGSFTYWYPERQAGLEAFKRAGFAEESYNLWSPDKYGWAPPEAFFTFCKQAGLTAWYELNPAYLYDEQADAIGQFSPLPRAGKQRTTLLDPEKYLPIALERAASLARWCKAEGVDVVWEVGNEDYVYFEPDGYARIAAELIKAIRRVDSEARLAVCGDSESWSTRDWQRAVLRRLRAEGIERLEYSSVHCYLTGVGDFDADGKWFSLPRGTARELHDSTIRAWQLIRGMYLGEYGRILDDAGFADTKLALTEFNPVHPGQLSDDGSKRLEHCMGRALGEAAIYPYMIEDVGASFSHDLVRSGPGASFFRRVDYTPGSKATYSLPLEARVMGLMAAHAQGQVLHKDWSGVCVSAHPWGLYVTVTNPDSASRELSLRVRDLPPIVRSLGETVTARELSTVDYPYEYRQAAGPLVDEGRLTVACPGNGLLAVSLPVR